MSPPEPYDYDWAVIRLVAHVHRECFENVGVVLHARRARFLGVRLCAPEDAAAACGLDAALVARYFDAYRRVGAAEGAGPIGLLPPSERFHWLTAPRSTALQTSPVHTGRTRDLPATLDRLYRAHVSFPLSFPLPGDRSQAAPGPFENRMGANPSPRPGV